VAVRLTAVGTFPVLESVLLEATGMHDPANNQTCPGTNGSTNTQPHVATEIFCTCFSGVHVCYNGHKIPDIPMDTRYQTYQWTQDTRHMALHAQS